MQLKLLHRYLLKNFFNVLFLCLLASVSIFLVFDLFERIGQFISEGSSFFQVFSFLLYEIPLVAHLMMPVSMLIATILSLGRLSQLSEITAMRACGASILSLTKPILITGFIVSLVMLAAGETIVPWATQRVDEIYNLDIKKKVERGQLSKANFWYRSGNRFISIGFYDSATATLKGVSVYELDEKFNLDRRIDAKDAVWGGGSHVGWIMSEVITNSIDRKGKFHTVAFPKLPLIVDEKPNDFYNMERRAETLGYAALEKYIEKLRTQGISVTSYLVDLAAKLAFPFVNLVVVALGIPFAIIPSRTGNLSATFVWGVTIGFSYYVVHAISLSLGKAELIPIHAAAWTANILLGSLGCYLLAGSEKSEGLV